MNMILKSLECHRTSGLEPDIAFKLLAFEYLWQGRFRIMIFMQTLWIFHRRLRSSRVDGCTDGSVYQNSFPRRILPSCVSFYYYDEYPSGFWNFRPAWFWARGKTAELAVALWICQHGIFTAIPLEAARDAKNKSWFRLCHQCCNVFIYAGSDLPQNKGYKFEYEN